MEARDRASPREPAGDVRDHWRGEGAPIQVRGRGGQTWCRLVHVELYMCVVVRRGRGLYSVLGPQAEAEVYTQYWGHRPRWRSILSTGATGRGGGLYSVLRPQAEVEVYTQYWGHRPRQRSILSTGATGQGY